MAALGRKIGFTNSAVMREYGVSAPIFGYVYDRTLIHAESGRAALSLAGTVQPKIEPEIVFKLRRSPPLTRDPFALLESVEWLAQGFELVQCHYPGWVFAAPDAISDSGFHARYAVGAPTPVDEDDIARLADDLAGSPVGAAAGRRGPRPRAAVSWCWGARCSRSRT